MAPTTLSGVLLPGFRRLPQRNRLQPKVLPWWKYSARRDAWAKTGPQGNSSDDDSPEISSRSSCDKDDDSAEVFRKSGPCSSSTSGVDGESQEQRQQVAR